MLYIWEHAIAIQYVGETIQKPSARVNLESSSFRRTSKYGHCCLLPGYFNKDISKEALSEIQINLKHWSDGEY